MVDQCCRTLEIINNHKSKIKFFITKDEGIYDGFNKGMEQHQGNIWVF